MFGWDGGDMDQGVAVQAVRDSWIPDSEGLPDRLEIWDVRERKESEMLARFLFREGVRTDSSLTTMRKTIKSRFRGE